MEEEKWYAIITDEDMFDQQGKLEYPAGTVISWGSVIAPEEELRSKGFRAVYIGNSQPDFSKVRWNSTTEQLEPIPEGSE